MRLDVRRLSVAMCLLALACEPEGGSSDNSSDGGGGGETLDAGKSDGMVAPDGGAETDAKSPDGDAATDAGEAVFQDEGPGNVDGAAGCEEGAEQACDDLGCEGGTQVCADGAWSECAYPEETCNGADDDCDGTADEDFVTGEPCEAGVGACAASGRTVCGEDGDVVCDAAPGAPADELCDGVDNDCDGVADNGFEGVGDACIAGLGACTTDGIAICSPDGSAVVCNAVPGAAAAEVCDGVDNDCDGATDEGDDGAALTEACFTGPPDAEGRGACAPGARTCADGEFGACAGEVLPEAETCDGADNDCDGETDEGDDGQVLSEDCYDGPPGSEEIAPCHPGTRLCTDGVLGACVDQVVPGEEICDGVDNDCSGEADDGLDCGECEPGTQRDCYTGPEGTEGQGVCRVGSQLCGEDRLFGACRGEVVPEAEQCDGLDNDCDGVIDDAVAGVGEACGAGVGACRAEGVTVCDGAAGEVRCDAEPGEPVGEVCNGVDDNCDGQTDEGLGLGEACAVGVGACLANGVNRCDDDGGVVCGARPGEPVAELCDGVDNNCDGTTDEGLGLGEACAVGVGECSRDGERVCDGEGGVRCGAEPGEPQEEACDGADNNCDGRVDEGNPGGGQECDTGQAGTCARGERRCTEGGFVCFQTVQPVIDICDGLDNDCNGVADDDDGEPIARDCYTGPENTEDVGECVGGVQTCREGRFGGCVGEVTPVAEICDGADNDCDAVDDNLADGGECLCEPGSRRGCYTGPENTVDVGVCRAGSQVCAADGLSYGRCEGQTTPQVEVCDGADNDCNAVIDDAPGTGVQCSAGRGECQVDGVLECNAAAGELRCDAVPLEPGVETCDRLDNNCNGVVDDVAGLGDQCTEGVGACSRPGNQVCDFAGGGLTCNAVPGDPVAETCNGIDDNCNGEVDDGRLPGVGGRCVAGDGACQAVGIVECAGVDGPQCDAVPGDPVAETCDGEDNDCDGVVDNDPVDAGQDCANGVGACSVDGSTVCVRGELGCDAVPGDPSRELCDGADNDCDGADDEELDCNIYRTCLAALRSGAVASGIYRLQPEVDGPVFNVYCDQVTDGGGWTLVGSTLRTTPNDQGQNYYDDLVTLAPEGAHVGIWNGLRPVGHDFDIRFACRDAVGAEDDPMTVDLSFYRNHWYSEITTGSDADSCFNEGNGAQQEMSPGRRDNLSGRFRPRNQAWSSGVFEGEDLCGVTSDFSVDFDDRGMDGDQSDGTDWGEDDGQRKCGTSGLATGQWFVYARERGRVAVVGGRLAGVTTFLQASGIAADRFAGFDNAELPDLLTRGVYDVLMISGYAAIADSISPELRQAIDVFGRQGGSVITEWDGATLFVERLDASHRSVQTAPDPLGWFRATMGGGGRRGNNTAITHAAADPVLAGVDDPIQAGGSTEFFFWTSFVDDVIPTNLETIGTFPGAPAGNPAGFPFQTHGAIERGRHCGGNVLFAHFDYADGVLPAALQPLVLNMVNDAMLPPPPELVEGCDVPTRPILMRCGNSNRDVSTFLPQNGPSMRVLAGCAPNANTQALLVTRSGAGQLDGAALRAYLQAGGIVITEFSVSDDVYNLAFDADVAQGARTGGCSDEVMPGVALTTDSHFWRENRFAAGGGGCGHDLSAFPDIVPLGGWNANTVSLAYRDLGAGRVWLVETDWQDSNAGFDDASRGLMQWMILHGAQGRHGRPFNRSGPAVGLLEEQVVAGGFVECYRGAYNQTTPLADIHVACDDEVLLLGCRQVGETTLHSAAMGERASVLQDDGNNAAASHQHNGSTWYYNESRSWGFAGAQQPVARNSCDTTAPGEDTRMCWHTGGGNLTPGWRCGSNTGLNGNADWERVIYQRGGPL